MPVFVESALKLFTEGVLTTVSGRPFHDSSSSSRVPPLTCRRISFSPRVRVLPSPDPNDRTTMLATNHPLNRINCVQLFLEKRSQCLPYNAERQAR